MSDNMKKLLFLLLILLAGAGPTAAHSCRCYSSYCCCDNRGLTSVPQDMPTTFTVLYLGAFYSLTRLYRLLLHNNQLTSLRSDMFVRLDSLQDLGLNHNNIHSIEAGTFNATPQLRTLSLYNNQLTSLRSDMFVGLDNLQYLHDNNIHSIEAGTFNATPQLRTLSLYNNQLTSPRSDMFVGLDNLQYLHDNNIHSIEAGTFNATPQLRTLHLYHYRTRSRRGRFPDDLVRNRGQNLALYLTLPNLPTVPPPLTLTLPTVLPPTRP
ncbi:hypothetical protein Bbelb_217020 [Branchiostoma belcheri]|nr:hypothetical protein Bbelb_217020 [Branchiostoma belcheri]